MVKGKKGKKSKASVLAHQEPQSFAAAQVAAKPSRRFYWWDYLAVGVFIVVFCELQKYVALWIVGAEEPTVTTVSVESSSLDFFFGSIWKGFLVVLILVWLYDYFYHDVEEDTA